MRRPLVFTSPGWNRTRTAPAVTDRSQASGRSSGRRLELESGFNHDTIAEVEQIRNHNLPAIYGSWDYLKNRSPDKERYVTAKLDWVAYLAGTRVPAAA